MRRFAFRLLTITSAALVSAGLAVAQQRPMGSEPTQTAPGSTTTANPNNPGMNNPDQMQQQNAGSSQMQDRDFVKSALEGGMAEVEMGKLAAEKGSSDDVKQFGQKMVQDHMQLGDQIKPVAQQLGVQEPKGLSKKDKAELAKLSSLSGAQFDNAYIKAMVKDHKKDLSDFKQEAQNTQNPQLKQAVQQGAQVIDQHLQLAEQMAKSHNVKA